MDDVNNKRRPGRPKVGGDDLEVNATFKLPDSLVQELKMVAVIERTTQKEIVITALKKYLADKSQ